MANAAIKTPSGNIRSPKCRMVYPALFKARPPKGETDESKARFGLSLLVPKDADLSALVKAIEDVKKGKFGTDYVSKKYKIKSPVFRTEDDPKFEEYAAEFPYLIRTSAGRDRKPTVVGPDRQPIADEAAVYGGRWCYASLSPWAYDHATGGKGTSIDLKAVQLAEDADPIGPVHTVRVEDEFEDVGGGASTDALFG